MKKETKIKRKKRKNTSSRKTTRTSKYETKNIKKRINEKKINKTKNTIILALLLVFVAIVLVVYSKIGLIGAAGIGAILFLTLIIITLFLKVKKKKKLVTILLMFVLLCGIAAMGAFAAFIFYIKTLSDPLYEDKKKELNKQETTTLYDGAGYEFAKLGSEMREKVTYEKLPEVLIDAIIATEDSRFFQHNGFDAPRFIKATLGQVTGNKKAGGASTLSMQVVKNVFTDGTIDEGINGIIRKFQDIYISVFKLEKDFTKEQIIEFYVNNHYLGGNIYGVEEASQTYFGKSCSELTLPEASIIAGMFKSPSYYKPDTHPENAELRRETVLYLMKRHGYITANEEKMANAIPVSSLVEPHVAQANPYQGYIDTVVKEIRDTYGVNAYTTSLKVYTTLDRTKQEAVDRVLSGEAYGWLNDVLQTGVAVVNSENGAILAIGAGRNRSGLNSYNYATQMKKQPGSTAKPLFDYGPGIEYYDWSTYTPFEDQPYQYSNGRPINNWDGSFYGTMTMRSALSLSRNIPALKAFQQIDNRKIIEFVTSLGITPEIDNGRIHEAHSIGAFDGVSPLQMAAAYAAFSNGGYYNKPFSVSKIEFRATGETKEHEYNKTRVMSEATAYMITSMLQDVALNGGTPVNVACKTGTTNFDSTYMEKLGMPWDAVKDTWLIGYSTKTVIGMWYGYDEMNQEMVNNGYVLNNVPASRQKDYLFQALVREGAMEWDRSAFQQPSSVVRVGVAAGSNPAKLAGPGTTPIYELFKKGTEPTETLYGDATIAGPFGLKATVDKTTKKITLSWSALSPGEYARTEYGAFGYNIYLDNRLLTWTDKTTYTATEFGTYKIVATYKGFSGVKSTGAEVVVSEPKEEKPTTPETDEKENNNNNTENNSTEEKKEP